MDTSISELGGRTVTDSDGIKSKGASKECWVSAALCGEGRQGEGGSHAAPLSICSKTGNVGEM